MQYLIKCSRFHTAVLASFVLLALGSGIASADSEPNGVLKTTKGKYYRVDGQNLAYYEPPKAFDFLVNIPKDIYTWLDDSFQRENVWTIAGVALSTGALVLFDQDLYELARDTGKNLHISTEGHMKKLIPGLPIEYPTDAGSAMYYLGDGMIPITITASMFGYGMYSGDPRTLQTSSQLAEGLLSTTAVVQLLKHTTGRQSPRSSTERGGRWRFFPNQVDYFKDVPAYDAFPSGHLATSMMTVTVLADNYPEYPLIRPVGYGLMVLLGFQMVNNGVHWISDYPLALAIGYGLGKVAVSHGRKTVPAAGDPEKILTHDKKLELTLLPMQVEKGAGLCMIGRF